MIAGSDTSSDWFGMREKSSYIEHKESLKDQELHR